MDLEVALRLAAFFVGAFLHATLVVGLLGRAERPRSERLLRLFLASIFLWHAGSFVGLALRDAASPAATLVRRLANAIAFGGLGFLPSLLLDTILTASRERGRVARAPRGERLAVALSYLPLAGLPIAVARILELPERPPFTALGPLVVPWTAWLVVVLAATSAALVVRSREQAPGERHLDRWLTATLVADAAGIAYVYILGGRAARFGFTIETVVLAWSIVPTLVFTYFVYRYRVLGYVVRDRALTLLAGVSFVAFYLLFVREAARRLEHATGLPAPLAEGALLVVLVVLFEPFGERLRELLRRRLAGGRERLRRQAALAAARLTGTIDADDVAVALRETLEAPGGVAKARLLLAEDLPIRSPEVMRLEDAAPVIGSTLAAGTAAVRREDVPSAAELKELERLDAHAVLALRSQERLHGALVLRAHSKIGFDRADLEALGVVAQGAALALQVATLLQEKVAVERREARAEKMASLGWLAASVAHEVKNPLSSIKAIAQVLRAEAGEGHRWRADLDVVVQQVDALDRAVERLLSRTKLDGAESKRMPADGAQLQSVLDRMAIALGPQARARGVRFEFRLGPRTGHLVASAEVVWEVLYNLATNAIEAMPDGGTFRVEEIEPAPPGHVRLRVADEGTGIARDAAGRVFEPFFTTKEHGHGLGLAIVERRVREAGGRITLVPHPDGGAVGGPVEVARGTTFEIEVPAQAATRPPDMMM